MMLAQLLVLVVVVVVGRIGGRLAPALRQWAAGNTLLQLLLWQDLQLRLMQRPGTSSSSTGGRVCSPWHQSQLVPQSRCQCRLVTQMKRLQDCHPDQKQ
jgi:hypothetical protein